MTQTIEHSERSQERLSIEALAGFDGPVEVFWPKLLNAVCQSLPGSQATVLHFVDGSVKPIMCCPDTPESHTDRGAWIRQAQRLVSEMSSVSPCVARLQKQPPDTGVSHLAVAPLYEPETGRAWGAICLIVSLSELSAGREGLFKIQLAAQVFGSYHKGQALRRREGDVQILSRAMQLLDAVNSEVNFRPSAIALCNQASDTWRSSRVSVGFLMGRDVKLRAMSHTEDISRKMQLVQDLEAVMEECLDQDSEVLVPQPDTATTINRQGRRYVDKHGPCKMCVLPLRLHDKVVGAMAVEWSTDHELRADEVEALRLASNLFTARLHQFHLDDRWFGARMATSLRKTAAVAVGPKHTWAKLLAIAVCGFLAFAFFFKGNDTVDSSFTVQTTSRQVITAPYAGTLLSVGEGIEVNEPVAGSDQTGSKATVLALLDTSELRVELAAVEAQVADFRAQADAARGENDLAGVEVALANVRRLQAQADLHQYRIERSTLTSPISGVVIEGDLRQRVNGVLEKGEVLFEIAPLDAMRAELLVPASRIGDIRSQLEHPDDPSRGKLASVSHPGEFIGFTVERIEPEAEVVDGQNIFRVRVSLDEVTQWLRPGVEGEAKVHVSKRSYAYLWTRDAVNWVRMKLWF